MRVCVYVEGPSDKLAMQALLRPLVEAKRQLGIAIDFFEAPEGDKKSSVLLKVPIKAANILANDPDALVTVIPDLYPRNKGFRHETAGQLLQGIERNFQAALQARGVGDDKRLLRRFKVFCFKYDLEALLLASPAALAARLGVVSVPVTWHTPIEDQNHETPPKRIVEKLFADHGKKYKDTIDAPMILEGCRYEELAQDCPQCFAPFVEFLQALA